jgi:hypothetical protein
MEALIDFAAVGGAILLSLGIALSLEWFALNSLMKMMPARQPIAAADRDQAGQAVTRRGALATTAFLEGKRAA